MGPLVAGPFFIGQVEEVDGSGAEEMPGFKPTRHELEVLAKYWLRRLLDIDFDWYYFQQFCSSERRVKCFARRRLGRLEDLLGGAAFDDVEKEVCAEFEKKIGSVRWDMFLKGIEPQRDEQGIPIFPKK